MVKNNPLSRSQNLVIQELNKEVLIYDLKINKAFCLNETSALVWNACDGNRSVAQISSSLGKQTSQPFSEDLVWLALDQFKKDNLLENAEQIISDFNGLSRREVIKKVGFASLTALPVISSLIAPTAAAAQSLSGACAGNQTSIPCGAATDDQFAGDCDACLASLPPCCEGQIIPAAGSSCSATAEGCSTCTRTCAFV